MLTCIALAGSLWLEIPASAWDENSSHRGWTDLMAVSSIETVAYVHNQRGIDRLIINGDFNRVLTMALDDFTAVLESCPEEPTQ